MEDFARTAIECLQREAGTSVEVCIEKDPITSALRSGVVFNCSTQFQLGRIQGLFLTVC